jgi:hypothetical protein
MPSSRLRAGEVILLSASDLAGYSEELCRPVFNFRIFSGNAFLKRTGHALQISGKNFGRGIATD